jgi:hypothetical protein
VTTRPSRACFASHPLAIAVLCSVRTLQYIVGSEQYTYYFAVRLSLGTNEFGASKGYTHVEVPVFGWDAEKRCVYGGNPIPLNAPAKSSECEYRPVDIGRAVDSVDAACADRASNCGGFAAAGYCSKTDLAPTVRKDCPRSCGLCATDVTPCFTLDRCVVATSCTSRAIVRELRCLRPKGVIARRYAGRPNVVLDVELGGGEGRANRADFSDVCEQCALLPDSLSRSAATAGCTHHSWLIVTLLLGALARF